MAAGIFLGPSACSDTGASPGNTRVSDLDGSIPTSQIRSGGPGKDGIPSLSNPDFVRANEAAASYLLDEMGPRAVAHSVADGDGVVVFWDRDTQGAMAYQSDLAGEELTFTVVEGEIRDEQTETTWRLDGQWRKGPLAGSQLEPVPEAFVAFWFAWPAFYPEVRIWAP